MGKKYILAVQGEGRGHMTQAMSMHDLLVEQGHTVCAVILGSSGSRDVPKFFFEKIKAPIIQLQSPNFVCDKNNKSINITKSIFHNISKFKSFKASLKKIDKLMKEYEPDVVINFFDLLISMYYRFYKPNAKMICVAHQYVYFHPDFEFPEGHWLDRAAIKFYTRLTARGSSKNLGLSFYKMDTGNEGVVIVPPLLRKEIFNMETVKDDFYLVYLVNSGYFEELVSWHAENPGVILHCFTDQPEKINTTYEFDRSKLFVHAINDTLFLEMMSRSKGLASTAGFESVCEAMYLGKPVLMVPIEGHYEQFCNSRDAFKAGAGIFSDSFDLSKLTSFSTTFDGSNSWFKNWVGNAKHRIYSEIISV
ncbi:MAG: glycosyltransferase family protein [bacterium]|nr:glycosyltransferase family protein [bacterium]